MFVCSWLFNKRSVRVSRRICTINYRLAFLCTLARLLTFFWLACMTLFPWVLNKHYFSVYLVFFAFLLTCLFCANENQFNVCVFPVYWSRFSFLCVFLYFCLLTKHCFSVSLRFCLFIGQRFACWALLFWLLNKHSFRDSLRFCFLVEHALAGMHVFMLLVAQSVLL